MERKLSTIFTSDVVAFSKMMEENEEKTLETLGERRQMIDVVIVLSSVIWITIRQLELLNLNVRQL